MNHMNKFLLVLGHTYMTKVKSKSFLISTIITVAIIFGLANIDTIIDLFDRDSAADEVLVIDKTGQYIEPLQQMIDPYKEMIILTSFDQDESIGDELIRSEEYKALLIIEDNIFGLPEAIYKANDIAEQQLPQQIEQSMQQLKAAIVTESLGLTADELAKIYEPISFETIALSETARSEEELIQARALVYVLLFVIYFAVLSYGSMIALEVATEKSSRVMEILISSAPPIAQMFAKIIGVALIGLTQLMAIFFVGFFSLRNSLSNDVDGSIIEYFGLNNVEVSTVIFAFVFFILGYLLYATIAAMLGSLVSRLEDVNQMVAPLSYLIIAAFLIAMFGLSTPDATFITVTSYIPVFTPMIMFLRVGMLSLPLWEIILGIGLLVVSIIIIAILGAKVYRGGVLMYGKSASLKDIKQAIVLGKKNK